MKRFNQRFLVLAAALLIALTQMTACGAGAEEAANDKTLGAAPLKDAAGDKKHAAGKTAENETAAAETQESRLVEIYDGREPDRKRIEPTEADEALAENEFKTKESVVKQKFGEAYCDESESGSIGITGAAKGAFTRPSSSQTAFLYEVCSSGSSHFGVGGIMIFENDKIVSHYVYGENGLMNGGVFALPDVNKNGLTELVLISGQTHQGYTGETIEITEFKDGNLAVVGSTTTATDNSGAAVDETKAEAEAYRIFVEPSPNPIFFRETYVKKGNAENWTLSEKSKKFPLAKGDFGKNYRIS